MNTPGGNTVSTAEHTMAMMLALSRNIAPAAESLRAGRWDRKKYGGVELYGKTLGVVGVGRIGREVAIRSQSFGMKTIGYDPYTDDDVMRKMGVEPVTIDELLKRSDYITFHTPVTDDTKDMVNKEFIAKMKDGVRIINCSRGAIVDEDALLEALNSGKVAGAALDVLRQEPPENTLLVAHPKCLVVPHLGASTAEAQTRVAIEIVEQVMEYFKTGVARNAANIPSVDRETLDFLNPYMVVSEKLGIVAGKLAGSKVKALEITYHGEIAGKNVEILTISVVKGVLKPTVDEVINYVNALPMAKARGIAISESKSTKETAFTNLITVTVVNEDGEKNDVSGTVFPIANEPRIVEINGYHVDARPNGWITLLRHADAPGLIGAVGTILGNAGINISDMTLGRQKKGGEAITMLNVEAEVSEARMNEIRAVKNMHDALLVDLR
jgi:D-3-phosphoglycerate dehydrogenase